MTDLFQSITDFLHTAPELAMITSLTVLLLVAFLANFIIKHGLIKAADHVIQRSFLRDTNWRRYGVISRLANIVPTLIIMQGITLIPEISETAQKIIQNVGNAVIIVIIASAFSAFLNLINTLYMRNPLHAHKPIKGYIQIVKLAIFAVAAILAIAALIDKSPVILLSGLGAMAAVLMLVFQDTLLSFVASIQISSSDMVRVGDWIEMPQLNADGDVIDIALHTVKVQNWDKTITTLPTRRLISDPFKNWRGMHESGGRRIKRAIFLDQNSIHFLTEQKIEHLKQFKLLHNYLDDKSQEISSWNNTLQGDFARPVNQRRMTNIGTFRAYVQNYLKKHPHIHQDMTMLVRQLQPTSEGLPLEIYCFTNTTAWAAYEPIQSDIFDHLYAILPEFGLRAFQSPSGTDFQNLLAMQSK